MVGFFKKTKSRVWLCPFGCFLIMGLIVCPFQVFLMGLIGVYRVLDGFCCFSDVYFYIVGPY